uniref:UBC core domain-containing protein n=1 Tax=Ascaris lumbricoides TaxID=6252 RepID=A0A9J2P546_ASCLU
MAAFAPSTGISMPVTQLNLHRAELPSYIGNIELDAGNNNIWNVLLLPPRPPYNEGAFRLRITFPSDYPFKPPHFRLMTAIYHPNIDERGMMCLPLLQYDNWKPAMTGLAFQDPLKDSYCFEVLAPILYSDEVALKTESLIFLLDDPEPERPIRLDLAEQLLKDNKAFMEAAQRETKEHAEKRPSS